MFLCGIIIILPNEIEQKIFSRPGKDVFAWIWICSGAKLCDHNPFFCHGSHISISSDKPEVKGVSKYAFD